MQILMIVILLLL